MHVADADSKMHTRLIRRITGGGPSAFSRNDDFVAVCQCAEYVLLLIRRVFNIRIVFSCSVNGIVVFASVGSSDGLKFYRRRRHRHNITYVEPNRRNRNLKIITSLTSHTHEVMTMNTFCSCPETTATSRTGNLSK